MISCLSPSQRGLLTSALAANHSRVQITYVVRRLVDYDISSHWLSVTGGTNTDFIPSKQSGGRAYFLPESPFSFFYLTLSLSLSLLARSPAPPNLSLCTTKALANVPGPLCW